MKINFKNRGFQWSRWKLTKARQREVKRKRKRYTLVVTGKNTISSFNLLLDWFQKVNHRVYWRCIIRRQFQCLLTRYPWGRFPDNWTALDPANEAVKGFATLNFGFVQSARPDPINRHDQAMVLFTNPSARAGYDTRSIFKRSLTGFEFRVFLLLD